MTDDGTITNQMLLEHMQASKLEMLQKFESLRSDVGSVKERLSHLERRAETGFEDVRRQFEDARLHRQALQEDLDATIRTQYRHQKQLAVLAGGSAKDD